MKKIINMVLVAVLLLIPNYVFADGASYSLISYEAMVNVKDGLTLVPYEYEEEENCFGEDKCNSAYETDEIDESEEYEDDEDSDMELIKLKYGTKIKVLYEDDDGDPCFKYESRYFCTDSYNLIGTKVDLKDFKDDKLQKPRQVVAFTDIAIYEGPSYVFNEAKAKIKPGDDVKATYYTDNLWFYVEGPGYTGWIFEDDFMTIDEENEDEDYYYTYKGYVKDDYEFIVYGNDALVFDENSQLLKEKIPSGTVIKSIGAIYGGFTSYVYYNNQNELRIVLMDEDETGYKMENLRLYINNNKDVKMYEVNKYNTPVDSSKILKNKTFYEVDEYTSSDDIEYYLLKINNSRYVVEISRSFALDRMLMPDKNYGAVAIDYDLLASKMSFGLLITANDTPSYESPDSKSGARETIKKNTAILPLAFQYNSKTKEIYLLVYNYGWIKVEENSFVANPDAKKEEYRECDEDDACGEGFSFDLNPYKLDVYDEEEIFFETIYQIEYLWENDDDEDEDNDIKTKSIIPDKTWKIMMAVFGNKNRQDYEENATSDIEELMNNYRIKPYEEYDDGDYYDDEDYDSDDDDDDWDESEENNEALGEASALKDLRDAKLSKQRANEKNKPTQAIAREQKNNKFDIIIPLLTAFAIAVLVSAVIVVLLIAAHKKKKLEETQKLEALKPEEPTTEEPTPVEEPKEEVPVEEASSEVPKEESTPVEETPSEESKEVVASDEPKEEPKEETPEEPKEEEK